MDPINKKGNKCFQYAVTVTLFHEEIKKDLQRITKNKSFINKYNQKGINFPSEKDHQKTVEKNNVTIALNVLYDKKEKRYILLMIQNMTQIVEKTFHSFNDSKWRRMALSCSKKTISVIKRNKD